MKLAAKKEEARRDSQKWKGKIRSRLLQIGEFNYLVNSRSSITYQNSWNSITDHDLQNEIHEIHGFQLTISSKIMHKITDKTENGVVGHIRWTRFSKSKIEWNWNGLSRFVWNGLSNSKQYRENKYAIVSINYIMNKFNKVICQMHTLRVNNASFMNLSALLFIVSVQICRVTGTHFSAFSTLTQRFYHQLHDPLLHGHQSACRTASRICNWPYVGLQHVPHNATIL